MSDSACIALDTTGDVLTATPKIDPISNLIACGAAGLHSFIAAGPGLTIFDGAFDGEVTVDLDVMSAVYFGSLAGTNVGAINGTPSGMVGGQLFVNVTNPSSERSALAYVTLMSASDYARVGSGGVWHNYIEYNLNGGAFAAFDSHTYDCRHPYNGGVTALEKAGGGMSGVFISALAPGATDAYGVRRSLSVLAASADGESFLDDSGNLSIRALVVIQ